MKENRIRNIKFKMGVINEKSNIMKNITYKK